MKELKVGERVTITLEVVEHSDCEGCFFNVAGYCGTALRSEDDFYEVIEKLKEVFDMEQWSFEIEE